MSLNSPRMLFVGDGWLGSNARSLAEGFRQAGAEVILVDTTEVSRPRRLSPSWFFSKASSGSRSPWSVNAIHSEIEDISTSWKPDVLFCFKTIHLDQQRLLSNSASVKIHYSADDVSNSYNLTNDYLRFENFWSVIVTTKRHNVDELIRRGVKEALMIFSAYDPAWHHLAARRRLRRYQVGFIGNYREDRKKLIVDLARRFGSEFVIEGPGWSRVPELVGTNVKIGAGKYGEDFSVAVSSIISNLVLLNSDNRDSHTCRSFEIPAAGGLFLGERTDEHQLLLEDGKECLLFSDKDELFDQLRYIEDNSAQIEAIAMAGYNRIVGGRHRYVDRARDILKFVNCES